MSGTRATTTIEGWRMLRSEEVQSKIGLETILSDWIRQLVCGNSRTAKLENQSSKRPVAREECRYTRDILEKSLS